MEYKDGSGTGINYMGGRQVSVKKSYEEINHRIAKGEAVVVTAEEIIPIVKEMGIKETAKKVDVVTTGTFGPMCSSGAFLNFGHSDPPIRMNKIWLNGVPASGGLAAVDTYIGATEEAERNGKSYGGAHVIEDLIAGKKVFLKAYGSGSDCYPNREVQGYIDINNLNEAFLFNPRNAYQNYGAATNSSERILYTYMGVLLPRFGNATYSTSGQLSPLLNDPEYRTIGIGTPIFLGGARGCVAWYGTQHKSQVDRGENGVPIGAGATLSLIGDMKEMSPDYIKAAVFHNYGISLFVGVGIPIPILDEDMVVNASVEDKDIFTLLFDYSVQRRDKPVLAKVNYGELRSGEIVVNGKRIPTAPLSSLYKAREIARELKEWIKAGDFLLNPPVQPLPEKKTVNPLILSEEE
jgi:uncharacterized protein (DUF39 family)